MRFVRYNEPKDPELRRRSKVLPDRWVDERWPLKRSAKQGARQDFRTSQFVRIQLLALVKGLRSFNRACRELEHHIDFRRFYRLRHDQRAPTAGTLSNFSTFFGVEGWTRRHIMLLGAVVRLSPPSPAGLVVVDSTDLPAAVRRTSKKKTCPPWPNGCGRSEPRVAPARAKADSPIISRATKSTRPVA